MWHKEMSEDAEKLCWSAIIPHSCSALQFSMGKAVSFPREYVGHPLPNQKQRESEMQVAQSSSQVSK